MVKVIAKFSVKSDGLEKFLVLAKELVETTVQEEGCISYGMLQDTDNPGKLFMVEEWQTREALDKHMASIHFTTLVPQLGKLTDSKADISVCKKVL